jgi:hypothetical protein
VHGSGTVGVQGFGRGGPGIVGHSDRDRGGVFDSDKSAQVQLVPMKAPDRLPNGTPITPIGISAQNLERGDVALPKNGLAGDLLTLLDNGNDCTLWFCVRSALSGSPARWAQVPLGVSFDGQL